MTRFQALTLSVLTHGLFYLILTLFSATDSQSELSESLNSALRLRDRQLLDFAIVEKPPIDPKLLKTKAHYQTNETVRIPKESRARFEGDETVNRRIPTLKDAIAKQKKTTDSLVKAELNGTLPIQGTETKKSQLPLGVSTVSQSLRETVNFGDFTALNTDQYLYFSFFQRINSRLRFQWTSNVENIMESLAFRNLQIREEKSFITEVEAQLDKNGYLRNVRVFRSCGYAPLDQAVIDSFQRTTPYINPPNEMVQDDGLIYLRYRFTFYYSPRIVARPTQ